MPGNKLTSLPACLAPFPLPARRNPTTSLAVRKAIIHAVNKADIVQRELEGVEMVARSIFAPNTPYTNIQLFPLLDYDAEKAVLLLEADGWKVTATLADSCHCGKMVMALSRLGSHQMCCKE